MTVLKSVTLFERFRAAAYHLVFSFFLLGIALYLVFGLWYPAPLDNATGVTNIYVMMLGIDLFLGPLLTFFLMKKNKYQLLFDLVVIVFLQISAYSYGLYIVQQGRPIWLVFVVDDFELVRPIDIISHSYKFENKYKSSIFIGPQWISAEYSKNPKIRNSQREDEMFKGISLAQRPETYAPLSTKKSKILKESHSLSDLNKYNDVHDVHDALIKFPQAMSWLPMRGVEHDMVVLLDKQSNVIKVVNLNPWS
jgi:hypothetical protein